MERRKKSSDFMLPITHIIHQPVQEKGVLLYRGAGSLRGRPQRERTAEGESE